CRALRSDRLVLVFARLPRHERRCKPLVDGASATEVEALHERLLRRTLAVARRVGVHTGLATTGDGPAGGVEGGRQSGETFAERLRNAVEQAFASGWREIVVVGADAPGLDAHHLRRAFQWLAATDQPRAAIGPARDGGYYLLALNAYTPAPFAGIP